MENLIKPRRPSRHLRWIAPVAVASALLFGYNEYATQEDDDYYSPPEPASTATTTAAPSTRPTLNLPDGPTSPTYNNPYTTPPTTYPDNPTYTYTYPAEPTATNTVNRQECQSMHTTAEGYVDKAEYYDSQADLANDPAMTRFYAGRREDYLRMLSSLGAKYINAGCVSVTGSFPRYTS